ncbi:hypothetical protein ACR78Z_17535 [Sphingobacterium thalpophilum]|uniref:Transposase n=1 Tax=Sphingobacterium thalpophilum TaxID=259 RepID=A0A4U9W064_9SPHI|nr:hypothetical protein [Sphingobacterium thalpophilum]VTR52367.1 Uncharacterised protein [Sphingobacterium thalpophilum]
MRNKTNKEHQICKVLQDYHAGKSGVELFEEYGIYGATIFELKEKYKDVAIDILAVLVNLSEENRRLKSMYAELCVQHCRLKELLNEEC